ncbi:hypothetical protein ACFLYX_04050 [Chloroflexota bacterium]
MVLAVVFVAILVALVITGAIIWALFEATVRLSRFLWKLLVETDGGTKRVTEKP